MHRIRTSTTASDSADLMALLTMPGIAEIERHGVGAIAS
jgi:hypothetical protein